MNHKIDNRLSQNINCLRFFLVVGVVFIHMGMNYSTPIMSSSELDLLPYKYVIYLLSNIVFSSAVPIFFLIASYLFYVNFDGDFQSYIIKIKSRVKSLLVPYLFFNLSYLAFKLLIQTSSTMANNIGGQSKRVVDYTFYDYLDAIFGMTSFPISYQFWFIRDLIIMVILAPVIWHAIKKFSWLLIVILFLNWLFNPSRIANIANESWLFFGLGCYLTQKRIKFDIINPYRTYIIFTYIFFACLIAAINIYGYEISTVNKLVIFLGVFVAWTSGDIVFKKIKIENLCLYMSSYSFFIFATHEPLLGILVKILNKMELLESKSIVFALYFLMPLFIVFILWSIAITLEKFSPVFYSLITGGRSSKTK